MGLLSIVVGLLVAIGPSVGDDLSPGLQPRDPIRLLSNSHQIDFPDNVEFRLEAEADAEITEIRLFYRLGSREAGVYGYPKFEPATRVSAEFRVKTSGANYIPNGVDVEYYYVLRDADGNNLESERFSLEYLDPAFEWQRFSQGNLTVLWHDRTPESVIEAAKAATMRLEAARDLLGLQDTRPMKAVILNGRREAGRSLPVVSEAARRGHLYGGFAFGGLGLFVLAGLNTDGMVHEMTHLLIDEAVDSPRARVPAWLNEGLAMYFESRPRGRQATLSRAALRDQLFPLSAMGNVPGKPEEVRVFYAQSWSVVKHLMDQHGPERVAALLGRINEGRRAKDAVQDVYGMTLRELEAEWKGQLGKDPSLIRVADPRVFGTSAIIAGAVAVSVLAIVLRWLGRRATSSDAEDESP